MRARCATTEELGAESACAPVDGARCNAAGAWQQRRLWVGVNLGACSRRQPRRRPGGGAGGGGSCEAAQTRVEQPPQHSRAAPWASRAEGLPEAAAPARLLPLQAAWGKRRPRAAARGVAGMRLARQTSAMHQARAFWRAGCCWEGGACGRVGGRGAAAPPCALCALGRWTRQRAPAVTGFPGAGVDRIAPGVCGSVAVQGALRLCKGAVCSPAVQ